MINSQLKQLGNRLLVALVMSIVLTSPAAGQPAEETYLCTVEQKAGIGGVHLEGSADPTAFVAEGVGNRFKIVMTRASESGTSLLYVKEIGYSGTDRDRTEWHTVNSVLHSVSIGDGTDFRSSEDLGILRLTVTDPEMGRLWFYHAGFEYPGGEDVNLSVRYGQCRRVVKPISESERP